MPTDLGYTLQSIQSNAREETALSKKQIKKLIYGGFCDRCEVVIKKAVNWYGETYTRLTPYDTTAYLELDASSKEVVKFSDEHVVIYTKLTIKGEVCDTVLKFRLNRVEKHPSRGQEEEFKIQHPTSSSVYEAVANNEKLSDICQTYYKGQVCVNASCVLELASVFRIFQFSPSVFWVERRLPSFQKFLELPPNFNRYNRRMNDSYITSCSEPVLRELQERMYMKSGKEYTVCDLQGCEMTQQTIVPHLSPLLCGEVSAGARYGVKAASIIGTLLMGPVGLLAGTAAGVWACGTPSRPAGSYWILTNVEFTNTLNKFGYCDRSLLRAFESHLEAGKAAELQRLRKKKEDNERRLQEQAAQRAAEEAERARLKVEQDKIDAAERQKCERDTCIAYAVVGAMWCYHLLHPHGWLSWLAVQLGNIMACAHSPAHHHPWQPFLIYLTVVIAASGVISAFGGVWGFLSGVVSMAIFMCKVGGVLGCIVVAVLLCCACLDTKSAPSGSK